METDKLIQLPDYLIISQVTIKTYSPDFPANKEVLFNFRISI